jgi:nucleoid-associated protein YgaU
MGLFNRDDPKKKSDFSNVTSGSSTAARKPTKPMEPVGGPAAGSEAGRSRGADFGNVRSGGSSTAPVTAPAGGPTSYVVKSGDSLSKIARRIYGDAQQWQRIYEANRELIGKNPDLIHPGQNLVIPQD